MFLISLRTIFEQAAEGDTYSIVLVGILVVAVCFILYVLKGFFNSKSFTYILIGVFAIIAITLFTLNDVWRDAYFRIADWLSNL